MNNIVAIAHKELRAYFASPIAYVVIGLFSLVFGYFYWAYSWMFAEQSMQMAGGMMGGGGPVNINQMMIRPLLQNIAVVLLFALPMVTMRTYAEEKRSGTIELLLTSPVSNLQIILGKFLGALALYAVMLAVTMIHVAFLFAFSSPEWRQIATAYLGLLLLGGCFIAVGLFISTLTKNQVIAGSVTFAVFLLLWIVNWTSSLLPAPWGDVLNALSITEHLDDFTKGVIDTKHLVYYLSFISFGLFLTAKAVDSERWRG